VAIPTERFAAFFSGDTAWAFAFAAVGAISAATNTPAR
jgi:hypothetical protein